MLNEKIYKPRNRLNKHSLVRFPIHHRMKNKRGIKPIFPIIFISLFLVLAISVFFVLADDPPEVQEPVISRTATTDTFCTLVPETREIIKENQCLDWDERNWTDINCNQYNRKPSSNCNLYNNYIADTDCSRFDIVGNRTNSSTLGDTPRSIMNCIKDENSIWDGIECKDVCTADSYCSLTESGNEETDFVCIDNGYFDNYETDCNSLDGCSWDTDTCNFDVYDYSLDETDCFNSNCLWEHNTCSDDIENTTYCAGGYDDVIREETINNQQCIKTLYSGLMNYDNGSEFVPIELNSQASSYLDYEYELTTAPYHAYFQDNIQAGKGFRFEVNDYWFTYDLSGGKMQWAVEDKGVPDWEKTKSIGSILSSSPDVFDNVVQYNDSFLNTDVQYKLQNELVKENFILKSLPADAGDFLYLEYVGDVEFDSSLTIWANGEIQTNKEFNTTGRIDFKDSNNVTVYYLPVPIATDSNDSLINLLYDIKPDGEKLSFGLKTPVSWLENAVYPVRVDPSIKINGSELGILEDADFTESTDRDGTNWEMEVDFLDGTGGFTMIKFDISEVPTGSTIINTTMTFELRWASQDTFDIWYSDNQSWVESELDNMCGGTTYCSDLDSFFTTKLVEGIVGNGSDVYRHTTSELQSAVQTEIDAGNTNLTFVFNHTDSNSGYYMIASKEAAITINRPSLNITYEGGTQTISDCTTLDNPGGNYLLDSDITDSSTSNCMDITANNVVLDCQGNTIDGNDDADAGINLGSFVTNITIKNCILKDWDTEAITFAGLNHNVTIDNVTIFSSPDDGIYCTGSDFLIINNSNISAGPSGDVDAGLNMLNCDKYTIENTVFLNSWKGIIDDSGDGPKTITNTNFSSHVGFDFYMNGYGGDCELKLTNVLGTDGLPIYFTNETVTLNNWNNNVSEIILCDADNSVINNLTMKEGSIRNNGLLIESSDNVNITNSSISGKELIDISGSSNILLENNYFNYSDWYMVRIAGGSSTIYNNTFYNGDSYELYLFGSDNNNISYNIFEDSSDYLLYGVGEDGNLIYNNLFNSSGEPATISTGIDGDNYFNTTKQSGTRIFGDGVNIGGNYYVNSSGSYSENCADVDYDGFCDTALTTTDGAIDYLSLSDEYNAFNVTQPTSGQTFTQDEPTAIFNITAYENMSTCHYSLNSGVTNYTMTNVNNITFGHINRTMTDGASTANFYCNATDDGEWFNYPVGITFDVDSVNITRCRDLTVANRTYELLNDITGDGVNDCIDIKNYNITFDGNDNKITINSGNDQAIYVGDDAYDYFNITNINVDRDCSGTGILVYIVNADNGYISNFNFTERDPSLNCDVLYVSGSSNEVSNGFIYSVVGEDIGFLNTHTFRDIEISGRVNMDAGTSNFINISYRDSNTESGSGTLNRKWYFSTEVNNSAGNLENAQVNIYDKDGNLEFSELTDSDGNIPRKEVIEYVNTGGSKAYNTPHTINVSKATYTTNTTEYNLTEDTNIFHYVTLELSNTAPTSSLYSPVDNAWSNFLSNDMICNSSDVEGNLKNITIYSWEGGTELKLKQTTAVTGSDNSTTFSAWTLTNAGAWEWNCYVCDDSSSCVWDASNHTLNVDTTFPIIEIVTPINNTNTSDTNLNVNYTRSDTNLDSCWYTRNYGNTNNTLASCTNITGVTWNEGKNNITIYINDSANNVNSSFISFTLDTTYPALKIVYPTNASNHSSNTINVNYTFSDTNLDSCWYSNDTFDLNTSITCGTNITGITWSEGTHDVIIWANDSANNVNKSSVSFFIDTVVPLISYGTGTEVDFANLSQNFIYVNTSWTETNFKNITFSLYYANGTEKNTTTYTSATYLINWTGLNDGKNYTYYVNITDTSNNVNSTDKRYITIDDTAPDLNIYFPVDTDTYNYNNQTLNFSVSDNLVGLSICWKKLNSGKNITIPCATNSTVNSSEEGTTEGSNTIYLWANDTLGNVAFDSATFSVSTVGPAIILDAPDVEAWLNYGESIWFNYTATDGDGLGECQLWGNWSGWHKNFTWITPNTGVMNFTSLSLPDGIYNWNVWCNDTNSNGLWNTNRTLWVDTTIPLISYGDGTEVDYANLSQSHIYVNTSFTETNFANITFRLYNDAGVVSVITYTTATYFINWTAVPSGNYTYYVNLTDTANNVNSTDIRRITLDNEIPNGNLSTPLNDSYSNTGSINFTANLSDNYGIKNITLIVYNETGEENRSSIDVGLYIKTYTVGIVMNVVDGIKKWWYELWDWAGNTYSTGNYTLTIDTTFPIVNVSHYSPTTIYNNNDVIIYGNISDINLDTVWLMINHSGTYENITITNYSDGMYNYTISNSVVDNFENISWYWYANDSADNVNVSVVMAFLVSNRNPYNVNITYPINNSYISTNWVWINFTSSDADSDTINYSIYNSSDGTNFARFNSTTGNYLNFSRYNFTDGAVHYLYVLANDTQLQNESIFNITFTIDHTSPVINSITYPLASPTYQCSMANISLNYSVTETNIDYCQFNVTSGGLTSTAHTIISDCSNTTFNVAYDNSVQILTLQIVDKAGNSDKEQRLIYIDTDNAGCPAPYTPPGGGGGGTPIEEEEEERTFCGDNICQRDGNDYGLNENFWNCPSDCRESFDFDELFYGLWKYCFDAEELNTPCFWTESFGSEESIELCGNGICERSENPFNCVEDCGRFDFGYAFSNCFDNNDETPCFLVSNLFWYLFFGLTAMFLILSFVQLETEKGKKTIGKYVVLKTKKRYKKWRRR